MRRLGRRIGGIRGWGGAVNQKIDGSHARLLQ
jgi:hypothetical protein